MSTYSRKFISSPARDAGATWAAIVNLLAPESGDRRTELLGVAGTATSIIADAAPESAPIVVTGNGPRTRIYCIYDEDAVDGSDANEAPLGFDPLSGDWAISLPCVPEDLNWVSTSLKSKSSRITARDISSGIAIEDKAEASSTGLAFDESGFLGS
jgi:hypothetical protein